MKSLAHSGQEAVIPGETEAASGAEWYKAAAPAEVIAWARDYIVKDLEESADDLRSKAAFLDGKASLLFDMMTAVAEGMTTPALKGPSVGTTASAGVNP